MAAQTDVLTRLLEHFPRAVCTFTPESLDVTGSWSELLVQLVYRRADPTRPGAETTFAAAHHPELGSLSYEMIGGQGLLTLAEWRAGAPSREGIWWTTATTHSTRAARAALLWHDVVPLIDRVESVADAVRVAEHLDVAVHADVDARSRRHPGGSPAVAGSPLAVEVEGLERLLAYVDGLDARLLDGPDPGPEDELAGPSPTATENRARRRAHATIAADNAVAVRRELRAVRERVDAALTFSREARNRVSARRR